MTRADGSSASFPEVYKAYMQAYPSSTRSKVAIRVRRSRLTRPAGRQDDVEEGEDEDADSDESEEASEDEDGEEVASVRAEDEEADEEDEDSSNSEDEGEAVTGIADISRANLPDTSGRIMLTRSGRRLFPLRTAQDPDQRTVPANERTDQSSSSAGVIMDRQSAQQIAASPRGPEAGVQRQSSAASHVGSSSASSSSSTLSTSATALDPPVLAQAAASPHPAIRAQGPAHAPTAAAVEATAAPQHPIRPSYAVPAPAAASGPSAASQTGTNAASVAPPSALSASYHQPLPVLTIPEPNGLRFERCVSGIEIEVSARNRATISWSDPTMGITPSYPPSSSFERLPAFHFKVLGNGQVLPVRLPPMTMKRVVGEGRGMEMAAVGVATEMGAQACWVGPDGYVVTLAM